MRREGEPSSVSLRTLSGSLLLVAVALAAAPAPATIVRSVEFAEQCAGADAIFVGTVRNVESRQSAARGYFETLVTLAVEDVVAGTAAAELTLRLAGGQVGNLKQSVDGMPEFVVGERYVVFMEPAQEPPLVSPIVGFNQGLYRVVRESGRDLVRDHAGRPLAASTAAALATAGTAPSGSDARAVAPLGDAAPSLEGFLAAVRASRPR